MDIKNKIEEILLTDYQYVDCYTVDKLLDLFAVVGQSEQLVCLECNVDLNKAKGFCPKYIDCENVKQTN